MPGRDNDNDQGNVERRRFLMGTGAGALAVGLAGCSSSQGTPTEGATPTSADSPTPTPTAVPETVVDDEGPERGGTFTVGLPSPPTGINILSTSSAYSVVIYEQCYAYGTTADAINFDIHPQVFTDWTVENAESGEPDVFFNMRTDLTFNDGEDLTKEDVLFTYNYLMDQEPGKYVGILRSIDTVEEASNDWDFHMKMNERDGLYEVRQLGLPILPKHKWEGEAFDKRTPGETDSGPVGAGWARVTKYNPDTAIELEFRTADEYKLTNDQWVKDHPNLLSGGPFLDKLRFKVFTSQAKLEQDLMNNNLDAVYGQISAQNVEKVRGRDDLDLVQGQDDGFGYFGFNLRRKPFDDITFRQSLSFLWDDVYWTQRLNRGLSIEGDFVISPGYRAVRPETGTDAELLTDPATQAFTFRESSPGVPDLAGIREFLTSGQVITGEGGEYVGQEYPGSLTDARASQTQTKYNYTFGEVKSKVLKDYGADKELYIDGKTIPEIKGGPLVYLMYPPQLLPELTKMDENFTQNMKALGIPVTREVQTFNSLITRIYGEEDFDIYHMGWGTSAFGTSTLYGLYHSDNADDHSTAEDYGEENNAGLLLNNSHGYGLSDDASADELIKSALTEMDSEKRNNITREAVEQIYLDKPLDVYHYQKQLWPVNSSKFAGFVEGIVAPGGGNFATQLYNLHQAE